MFKERLIIVLIFGVFLLSFIPYYLVNNDRGGDDASYRSHAFTLGLDFDLNYNNESVDVWNYYKTAPAHPIGTGVLVAPFVFAFSIIDRIVGNPIIYNHKNYLYSWSYFAILFASSFYFFLSLFMYYDSAKELLGEIGKGYLFILVASSGILYYVVGRFTMGHAMQFFSFSLVVWSSVKIYSIENFNIRYIKKNTSYLIACAIGIILTIAIRQSDTNVFILPLIIFLLLGLFQEKYYMGDIVKKYSMVVVLSLICFMPLGLLFYKFYGALYPSMYKAYSHSVPFFPSRDIICKLKYIIQLLPSLRIILFSSEFGIIFSNPLIVMGNILILYYLFKNLKKNMVICFILMLLIFIYNFISLVFVLIWQTTASVYGFRYLYPLFPLAFFEYIYMMKIIKRESILKWIKALVIILCMVSIFSQIMFSINSELYIKKQVNAFGKIHTYSANGYYINLLRSVPKASTWISLFSKRTPGFVLLGTIGITKTISYDKIIDNAYKLGLLNYSLSKNQEYLRVLSRVYNIPFALLLQVIILCCFWLLVIMKYVSYND